MKNSKVYSVYIVVFVFFYILSIFITHISNSQYVVTIKDYKDYIDNSKIVLYISSFILLGLFYKVNKYTFLDLFICVVFLISYYYSRITIAVFIFFLFVKYANFSLVVKTFLFAVSAGIIFVFVTHAFDLYHYSNFEMYRADGTYRMPLGYKYPTYFPNISLFLYLGWVFLRKNKITFLEITIIGIANYVVYVLTDTRAIYYLVNLLIFCVVFLKYFRVNYNTAVIGWIFKFSTIYLFLILAVISIWLNIKYDSNIPWMNKLNQVLSGRLYYGHKGYIDYGISLLGQQIDYVSVLDQYDGNNLFVIDSGYLKVLLDYGIILFALITFGFIQVGRRIVSQNETYFGLVMIIALIDISINPHMIQLDFNPFFFALGYYGLYKDNLFK
ncbi:hypothetical protein EB837_22785 [Kluyvera ascorbata]|uniref:Wzy n=1 Tax=Kluyvera ascorbata TaxID=51288 RepID=A0A3N2RRT1_9ENTR|nr:hypothetical protein [Kluyvera ascorbata]ROU10136.1 hypothetical protein EB837_22785 [Kluyvera ascorbata]